MIRKLLILLMLYLPLYSQVSIQFNWDKYIERTDTPEHYKADSSVTHFRIYEVRNGSYSLLQDSIPRQDTAYTITYNTQDSIAYFAMTAINPNNESKYSNIVHVVIKQKPIIVVFGTPSSPVLRSASKIKQEQYIKVTIEITDIYDTFRCTVYNNTANPIHDVSLILNQRVDWIEGTTIDPDIGTNNDGKSSKTLKILDTINPYSKLVFTGDLDGRGEPTGTIKYNSSTVTIVKNGKTYEAVITL